MCEQTGENWKLCQNNWEKVKSEAERKRRAKKYSLQSLTDAKAVLG